MGTWDSSWQTLLVEVDGVLCRCLVAGDAGPPVVLIHGASPDSAALSWAASLKALSEGHRVTAPDLPGYGESHAPDAEHTIESYTDFLAKLMDALVLDRVTLGGISMGGAVALGFTLRWPEKVDKLILVDSHGLGGRFPHPLAIYALAKLPLLNKAVSLSLRSSRRVAKRALRNLLFAPGTVTDELVDEVLDHLRRPGVNRASHHFRRSEVRLRGPRTNHVEQLGTVRAPTLIVHGRQDGLVPVSCAREAHERMPGSQLIVFEDCGHWPPREHPKEFNRVVSRFIGGAGRARRGEHAPV